jgi:signal transduction histidine kinase
MTSDLPLDWATLAISIFNTILLLWLGLTVILNAEQRSLGVWISGGGLLMSSLFFLSHTAILGMGPLQPEAGMNAWWRLGWIPVVSMPFAWYLVMLWYSGYWGAPPNNIHQRHQVPLVLATLLAISTVGLVFLFNALPSYNQVIQLDLGGVLSIGGVPVLMFIYPLYLVMCIGFSLDVLLQPGQSIRLMGQLARQRARPWLITATAALLFVSITVGVSILWALYNVNRVIIPSEFAMTLAVFDLVIDVLIAITIISVGQAVVAYEIFTGKTLPRRGLQRYWRLAMLVSFSFALIIAWALIYQLQPIYLLLLCIVLVTGIYAFMAWRSFAEQEHYLKMLHPFITSQHQYDNLLLQKASKPDFEISKAFDALCENILGVEQAILIPSGSFSPLGGKPIAYPNRSMIEVLDGQLAEIQHKLSAEAGFSPILLPDMNAFGQHCTAITLWSERGPVGGLLLGEKKNGSLLTQEEIEIARTMGERLIDNQASQELARRLMELERQHLTETRVIDQQTRRTLHDDILPRLQSAMIKLSSKTIEPSEVIREMSDIHHQLTQVLHELPAFQEPELERLGLIEALHTSIENEYTKCFNTLTWQVDEQAPMKINTIPGYANEVLFHATREAVRNAARHGYIPDSEQPFNLSIRIGWEHGLVINIQDDGVGFVPGTIDGSRSDHGLALHSTLMAVIGGSLVVQSVPKKYTRVELRLPE